MLNRVTVEGRLATEPEGRILPSGRNQVSFALAIPRRKTKEGTERPPNYVRIIGWGSQADFALNYLTKGRLVSVDGRIEQRCYLDKTGQKRSVVEIIASELSPLDKPKA